MSNTMAMRQILNLVEQGISNLRRDVITAVKQTDDEQVLQRTLSVLQAGDLDQRAKHILDQDRDARKFSKIISDFVVSVPGSMEEKNRFLDQFPKGILDVTRLMDGKPHSFSELVGPGFNTELFRTLTTRLVSQGVGPGEVALAVFSPQISWSGREAGGGDVTVNGKSVEVKTSIVGGGRWVNLRKAKMDLAQARKAILDAVAKNQQPGAEPFDPDQLPLRLNSRVWVNDIRPRIAPRDLDAVTKAMAQGLFSFVNTDRYQQALKSGTVEDIGDALMSTGFENYKTYSGFDGMLMMDVNSETAQYFTDYDQMRGKIKTDSIYLLAPENEAMPKVSLASAKKTQPKKSTGAEPGTQVDLVQVTAEPRFTGPAAKAARSQRQPRMTADVLGREKRKGR